MAILSGPWPYLTLHRAKRFWWSGYAIADVCGAGSARLPPLPVGCFVLANPNYRAVRHRGIGIAQPRKRRLEFSLPPRFFPGTQGSMTGGRSHDPVTVVTTQGALAQALSANTRPLFRPFDHGIKPGGSRPGSQVWCFAGARVDLTVWDLVDETFLVRAPFGRAKPLDVILIL